VLIGALFFNINTQGKTMGYFDVIGNAVSGVGSALGLPEFGISESLSGQAAPANAQPYFTAPSNSPSGSTSFYAGNTSAQSPSPQAPGQVTNPNPQIEAQYQAQQAAAAQAANIARLTGQVDSSRDNIYNAAHQGLANYANSYNTNAIGLANKYGDAQKGVNTSRENVELNRLGGMQSLADKVRQGVQSGAIGLANRNASDSSGAEGLARGWQRYGNQQASAINADTFNQNRSLDEQQSTIVRDKDESLRQLHVAKEEQVQNVQADVESKLQALDAEAANQGITGRVQIGVLKQQVVQDAMARLGELDGWLQDQLNQHQALGREQVIQNAGALQAAGRQGDNPYQLQGPQVAVQGAPISQLPLYTQKRRQD
jgi:hypothetical protein